MSKKMLFISHAQIDTLFAKEIKSIIDSHFMGAFDIFVSSEDTSIRYGDIWANKIFDALNKTTCMLSLCSPTSVFRPWIPFEMGYVEAKGAPCIPICIRGLTIQDLPMPLNFKQAILLDTCDSFNALLSRISNIFELKERNIDEESFKKYNELTQYTPELSSSRDEYDVIHNLIDWHFKGAYNAFLQCFQSLDGKQHEISPENTFYAFEVSLNMECFDLNSGKANDRFYIFCREFDFFVETCKLAITITDDTKLKKIMSSFILANNFIKKSSNSIKFFRDTYLGKPKDSKSVDGILDFFYKVQRKEIEHHPNINSGFIVIFISLQYFKYSSDELKDFFKEKNLIL